MMNKCKKLYNNNILDLNKLKVLLCLHGLGNKYISF